MIKKGHCKIEGRNTIWRQLPNRKWICASPNCSWASGQYDKPPKSLKKRRNIYY